MFVVRCIVYIKSPKNQHKEKTNIAVIGPAGSGKSTVINAVRNIDDSTHPDFAPVDVNECTMIPTPYKFPDTDQVVMWDLPGGGTQKHPKETYVRNMGLRYFDCVFVISAGRFGEVEQEIMKNLEHFKVPYYPIRNKINLDIDANKRCRGKSSESTIADIRANMLENYNDKPVYLINAWDLGADGLDGKILLNHVIDTIREDRIRSDHVTDRSN